MSNSKLEKSIKLSYLDGINDSIVYKTDNEKSVINLLNNTKSLLTHIVWENDLMPRNKSMAIFNAESFLKILSLYDDINIEFVETEDYVVKIKCTNDKKKMQSTFIAADPDVIVGNTDRSVSAENWDIEFVLDKNEVNRIKRVRSALSSTLDHELFYVFKDSVVIGGSNLQRSNKVEIKLSEYDFPEEVKENPKLRFNLEHLISILGILKEDILFSVNPAGLMRVSKVEEDFKIEYYLSQIKAV